MSAVTTRLLEGADHTFAIQRTQDMQPIIERAHDLRAVEAFGSKDVKHAAEIPVIMVEQYLQRTGITFHEFCNSQDHIKAIVNDPANAVFRIWQGRI